MLIVEITDRRDPRSRIKTPKGDIRYDTWLDREADRLRAGRFWRQCFVDDEDPDGLGVALVGVPRMGTPTEIVRSGLTPEGHLWSVVNERKIA